MSRVVSEEVVNASFYPEPDYHAFKSKVGKQHGHLTVVKFAGYSESGYIQYFCKCVCGRYVIRHASHLTPSNLVTYKNVSCGCEMARCRRVPLEEMIRRVKEATDYEVVEAEELWTSKWVLRCKDHGLFKMRYSTVHQGLYGCPNCSTFGFNPEKDAVFYVSAIIKQDTIVAYKYGITQQRLIDRMKQIVAKTEYKIAPLFTLKGSGHYIRDLENYVKTVVDSGYFDKGTLASGFTETVCPSEIIKIVDILQNIKE